MKKIYLLVLVAVIAFSGCKKDTTTPALTYTADVTINNVKTSFTDMKHDVSVLSSDSYYDITNYGGESNDIYIYLLNPVVGSLDFTEENYIHLYIGSKIYYSVPDYGTFTITQKDSKSLVGTFSGKFIDSSSNTITITGNFQSLNSASAL